MQQMAIRDANREKLKESVLCPRIPVGAFLLIGLAGGGEQTIRFVKVNDAFSIHAVIKIIGVGGQGGKDTGFGQF